MPFASRPAALAALPMLASVLVALPAPATSAGETCQGQLATIVNAEPNATVTGTDGPDVIVTGPARTVLAMAGDDVICISESAVIATISAGPGDDHVLALGPDGDKTFLGTGSDTFTGGAGPDRVVAGGINGEIETDVIDTIRTGAGDDNVVTTTARERTAFADLIDTGEGDDSLVAVLPEVLSDSASIDLGPGRDRLDFRTSAGDPSRRVWLLDNREGRLATDGADGTDRTRFVGAESFRFDDFHPQRLDFFGSDADESVRGARIGSAAMGGGDDVLVSPFPSAPINADGGEGDDTIFLDGLWFRVDMRRDVLVEGGDALARLTGFRDVYAAGVDVTIIGDEQANTIQVSACRARIIGGKGDDVYRSDFFRKYHCTDGGTVFRGGQGADRATGSPYGDRLVGGPGDDALIGARGSDVILGGPGSDVSVGGPGADRIYGGAGRDKAVGGSGRDACRAERKAGCER